MLILQGITRYVSFQSNRYGNCKASQQTDEQEYLLHDLQPCCGEEVRIVHKKMVCVLYFLF